MKQTLLSKLFVIGNLIMLMILLSFSPTPVDAQEPSTGSEAAQPPAPFPQPRGTAFTYQGYLSKADGPVTASCDMTFQLFHVLVIPPTTSQFQPVSEPQTKEDVEVINGVFSAILDFGQSFGRSARWLNITVDCGGGPVGLGFQPVYAVPFALYALTVENIPDHNHMGETWSSDEALTLQNNTAGGVGVYAGAGDGNTPDLILGGNNDQEVGDNGRVASDPQFPSSDIFLVSNDAVVIKLNNDQSDEGQDGSAFSVRDQNDRDRFRVHDNGDICIGAC